MCSAVFERIKAEYLAKRGKVVMQDLFADQVQNEDVPVTLVTDTEQNVVPSEDIHKKAQEFMARCKDEHFQKRKEFSIIIPAKIPSYQEVRKNTMRVVMGGGRRSRARLPYQARKQFELIINQRTDEELENLNWLYEVGLLR